MQVYYVLSSRYCFSQVKCYLRPIQVKTLTDRHVLVHGPLLSLPVAALKAKSQGNSYIYQNKKCTSKIKKSLTPFFSPIQYCSVLTTSFFNQIYLNCQSYVLAYETLSCYVACMLQLVYKSCKRLKRRIVCWNKQLNIK